MLDFVNLAQGHYATHALSRVNYAPPHPPHPLQYMHEAPPRYGAMYRGPSFGYYPVGEFYPSLAGIFPAQLCQQKNIVFSLCLRAITLTRPFTLQDLKWLLIIQRQSIKGDLASTEQVLPCFFPDTEASNLSDDTILFVENHVHMCD